MHNEKEQSLSMIHVRRSIYVFLSEIFLHPIAVPGHDFVDKVFQSNTLAQCMDGGDPADESGDYREGSRLLKNCHARFVCGDRDTLQKEIAIDRTRLCRGTRDRDTAPSPPYEALYLSPQNETEQLLKITSVYSQAGIKINSGTHERMDYIGIELAFMSELCAREYAAVEQEEEEALSDVISLEKEFLQEHLVLWVPNYCGLVIEKAHTDFFSGIACLLRGFLQEEQGWVGVGPEA